MSKSNNKRKLSESETSDSLEQYKTIYQFLQEKNLKATSSSFVSEAKLDAKKLQATNAPTLSALYTAHNSSQATATKKTKVESESESNEESSDDESEKKPAVAVKAAAAAAKKQESSDSESSDSDSDSDEEDSEPKKPAAKAVSAKKEESSSSSESESESSDDDSDAKQKTKPATKAVPVSKAAPATKKQESSDSESESDSDSDEESEPKKPAKKPAAAAAAKKEESSSSESESDDDEDEEEMEVEEEKPKKHEKSNGKKAVSVVESESETTKFGAYVKGLPWKASDSEVSDYFKSCGKVSSVEILYEDSGKAMGAAKVFFSNRAELDKALALDGQYWPGTERWLKITESKANESTVGVRPEGCDTVFVGNLPWDVTEDQLKEIFGAAGEVSSVRLATNVEDGSFRGFGHVSFYTAEDTDEAVKLAGTNVNGRPLRVDYAPPRNRESFGGGRGRGRGGDSSPGRGRGAGRGGRGGRGGPNTPTSASKNKGFVATSAGKKTTFD